MHSFFRRGPVLTLEAEAKSDTAEPMRAPSPAASPAEAFTGAIGGMSIEQLVELRPVIETEIQRLQLAIAQQPERARLAFERRDAAEVAATWQTEAELIQRLAWEQARLDALVARLDVVVAIEVHQAQSAIRSRVDVTNARSQELVLAVLAQIAAAEAAMTQLEQEAGRLGDVISTSYEQAATTLRERCSGYVPIFATLQPNRVAFAELSEMPAQLERLLERVRAAAQRELVSHWTLGGR
jgi:hypothetical protein